MYKKNEFIFKINFVMSGEDLSSRRRRGTGGIESSKKINGLGDRKTYDIYGSSSGYSSEDDYTGIGKCYVPKQSDGTPRGKTLGIEFVNIIYSKNWLAIS